VVEGDTKEAEVEEAVMLLVEDCEASLVPEETELCTAEFVELERPEWEDGLEEEEEPEVDPDEWAVFVTLPEPLAVLETLLVDDVMPAFGSDQQ
jgi:hypothetical protein